MKKKIYNLVADIKEPNRENYNVLIISGNKSKCLLAKGLASTAFRKKAPKGTTWRFKIFYAGNKE